MRPIARRIREESAVAAGRWGWRGEGRGDGVAGLGRDVANTDAL